jgi:hypothetical protein
MVSASAVHLAYALMLCTVSAAPARGQRSIQKKRARVAREVGTVGAEGWKTDGGKMPIVAISNKVQPATVSFRSDESPISDDAGPEVSEKIEYTPTWSDGYASNEQSSLPSFNFVVFCVAVVGLVKFQLHLRNQRLEPSKKDCDVKDWLSVAQQSPYVQEALVMIGASIGIAGSMAVQARNAALANQHQTPVTDEKCDFGLPEEPHQLDAHTMQEATSNLTNIMEMSYAETLGSDPSPLETPAAPVDIMEMALEEHQPIHDESNFMDRHGLMDNDTDDLAGL